jgi:hypothetical protein
MQELAVGQIWMAGVMGIMAAYGVIALIGYALKRK